MIETGSSFKKSGYLVIKNIVDKENVDRLYAYTLSRAERGNLDDGQVPGSPSFYQDKEVVALQKKLLPTIQEKIQTPLENVFVYHRVYRTGAILRTHKDAPRAEISVTINLGQKGEPWDLWLVDYDENTQRIVLEPGDALVYQGSKLSHWRGKLVDSDYVSQVMFHCIDKNGKHKSAVWWELLRKLRKKFRELRGISY